MMKLDIKRFYIGKDVSVNCPMCSHENILDGKHNYLSYPDTGKKNELYFCCQHCDCDLEIDVYIDVKINPQPCSVRNQ